MNLFVSVLVPFYNVDNYIERYAISLSEKENLTI